MTKCGFI